MNEDKYLSELLRISSYIVNNVCEKQFLEEATTIPLSDNQFSILKILNSASPFNISDIAKLLAVSNAATGKNIDKLVQHKLVRRRFRKNDRRTAKVSITQEGKTLVQKFNKIKTDKQAEVFKKYNKEEKDKFTFYLRKFVTNTLHEDSNMDLLCLQCDGFCGDVCVIKDLRGTCLKNTKEI